jgi:hypothetical protein
MQITRRTTKLSLLSGFGRLDTLIDITNRQLTPGH